MPPALTLTEYTEPFSPWAWGSDGKLRRLRWAFGDRMRWRRVFIGAGAEQAPEAVARHTGMPTGVRPAAEEEESDIARRVVVACDLQGAAVGDRALRRLREAFFLRGTRFTSIDDAFAVLDGTAGLSLAGLVTTLGSDLVVERLRAQADEAARPSLAVRLLEEIGEGVGTPWFHAGRWRYTAPTLRLLGPGGEAFLAGWKPWDAYEEALRIAFGTTLPEWAAPDASEVLAHFASMTDAEFEMICDRVVTVPRSAVRPDPGHAFWTLPTHSFPASDARARRGRT